ncbi:unnamed protein product, partial [Polarella glacialis]
ALVDEAFGTSAPRTTTAATTTTSAPGQSEMMSETAFPTTLVMCADDTEMSVLPAQDGAASAGEAAAEAAQDALEAYARPLVRWRVWGKRPAAEVCDPSERPPKRALRDLRAALGHSLSPPERGREVQVTGDGWGGGSGTYGAIVTEADDLTFTVIRTGGWEETHVLREHCIF